MANLHLKGYAARLLLEASVLDSDKSDATRYYKLEVAMGSDAKVIAYSTKDAGGNLSTKAPVLGLRSINTGESLSSDQSATLVFNGASDVASDLMDRIKPMDRLRIEMSTGDGWSLAFDGFVSMPSQRLLSTEQIYSNEVSVTASGLWKFLTQSWFNWQGVIQPLRDVGVMKAGNDLFVYLSKHSVLPGQDIVRAFVSTALSFVDLKTGEGHIEPGRFFEFGTGREWSSAFGIAYPQPGNTLPSMRGSLVSIIQMMAQPDIHECFCTYRKTNGREKPTIIFRPRPFPGKKGDDAGWNALKVHTIKDVPGAKTVMSQRTDGQHPNAFHWAQGSATDSGLPEFWINLSRGYVVDMLSIARYGYSDRPVASTMPPLSQVPKDNRNDFVDAFLKIVERMAYQEAPLPSLWTRTTQMPLTLGIRSGDVVEDYTSGKVWTGYVSTVSHRLNADPWSGQTSLGLVRCLPCTAKEYPDKVRSLVNIEYKKYVVKPIAGAAEREQIDSARRNPYNPSSAAAQPINGVPYGAGIVSAASARNVPPWVLAHMAHIESSFGAHPDTVSKGGFMQFEQATADGLNLMGYDKPFSFEIAKRDPEASLDAAAWYVNWCKKRVDSNAPGVYSESQRWQWAIYFYNHGPTDGLKQAQDQGWQFSESQMAMDQYGLYWGPGAIQKAQAQYGGLQ